MLNAYRHFFLYAKSHYQKSTDMISDLKEICKNYTGCPGSTIMDIITILSEANENRIKEIGYSRFESYILEQSTKNILDPSLGYYSVRESLIRAHLFTMRYTEASKIEGELGLPDFSILPEPA